MLSTTFANALEPPDHASVDDICDLLLSRAVAPRAEHRDPDFDDTIAAIGNRYDEAAVREVVHLVLVDGVSFRTVAADLEMRSIDGARIGTIAGCVHLCIMFLRELNAEIDWERLL